MADPKIRWRVDAGVTQANLAAQLNTVGFSLGKRFG
jgi:hypothetical protein